MELKDITTAVGTVGVPAALLWFVIKTGLAEIAKLREQVSQLATTIAVLVRTIDLSDAERSRVEEALAVKPKEP